jgi:hypothetical protein
MWTGNVGGLIESTILEFRGTEENHENLSWIARIWAEI